jgi:integrase
MRPVPRRGCAPNRCPWIPAHRALAEAGCSTHEIAAITGHETLAMVELYTRGADQKRRAAAAIQKLELASKEA